MGSVKYEVLRDEITRIRHSELSWPDFASWFGSFYEDIMHGMQSLLASIDLPKAGFVYFPEPLSEEVETTLSGLEDCESALNLMWEAVDEQSLTTADKALAIFLRGDSKLKDRL